MYDQILHVYFYLLSHLPLYHFSGLPEGIWEILQDVAIGNRSHVELFNHIGDIPGACFRRMAERVRYINKATNNNGKMNVFFSVIYVSTCGISVSCGVLLCGRSERGPM